MGLQGQHVVLAVDASAEPTNHIIESASALGIMVERHEQPPTDIERPTIHLASPRWTELASANLPTGVILCIGDAMRAKAPVVCIPGDATPTVAIQLLRAAAQLAQARADARDLEQRITALNEIGIALSAERDLNALLERILTEARRFTRSEAASLYLLDEPGENLNFVQAQCEPVVLEFHRMSIPVNGGSIAGHVARTGDEVVIDDAYELPADSAFSFNAAFDRSTGFRTRAMVALPMRDHQGHLVGVLQLMNPLAPDGSPTTYAADLIPLLKSLATQAAVSVRATEQTAALQDLFDSFAHAAVTAIELRDPTTAGHSQRVADYSVVLAEAADRVAAGALAPIGFTREEMTELRYAALLHDFGKIGVPERVLVKAKKLEDHQLERIKARLAHARDAGNAAALRQLRDAIVEGRQPTLQDLEEIEAEQLRLFAEIDGFWDALVVANEPTVLAEESGATLRALTERSFRQHDGTEMPLLTTDEFELLSIPRGSLSAEERLQIEAHVTHTVRFLSTIPWTRGLRRVPEIAGAHHEKLHGGGYPARLPAQRIPVQSRILSVCDVFDALTAADRPYKKAVPRDKSLQILEDEAVHGSLDGDLVALFIELTKTGVV